MHNNAMILVSEASPGIMMLSLNRPEKNNAINGDLIKQFCSELEKLKNDNACRVVLIAGNGIHFCAGADLAWMKKVSNNSYEENVEDAKQLAILLYRLYTFPKPTIALVQGATFGGGVGIVACCDIAIAETNTHFCFSEVKIGLTPSVISPYVIAAIGERAARYYFLTAEKWDAERALSLGFVHQVVPFEGLESAGMLLAHRILKNSPYALTSAKSLISEVSSQKLSSDLIDFTARHLATMRASPDGQEGLKAFLEKREPVWN